MFLECAADGGCESHFKTYTEPVLTADVNYRIVREEDSASLKSSLISRQILVFQVEQKRSVLTNHSFRLNWSIASCIFNQLF